MHHCPLAFRSVPAVVAIPVRDEAERIGDCLLALSRQEGPAPGVVLLVNNTVDETMSAVAELAPSLRCPVIVIEHRFPEAQANAGHARRAAMQHADRLASAGVPLLTTDADGRAAPDWLAANLRYLSQGLDAVFGRAEIDPVEAARIPPGLQHADAQECAYAGLLDEIESLIDPDLDDPWPRHTEHSGASIAVSRQAYRVAGGIPCASLGEDRAFHAALRLIDARVRHPRDVSVVVSGRILGRAAGGMADTIRRRLVAPDTMLDDALEPAADRLARVSVRAAARRAFHADDAAGLLDAAARAGLGPAQACGLPGSRWFGEVWAVLDGAMARRRVHVADLPRQMASAFAIRASLQTVVPELLAAD